ncbi:N-acetylmuramoyl-L-alanine amidase [Neomoorella glycerini]|uniref:N-acetylmuramoyl-L-alanine amidase n=1 Tax=Neomoorella glycerini TaxID=55779 RepID=A0A6I5ZSL8_9FIRM|nr:N-acetylmuramoyl-L-alanine amidase [Moorella glycerini]QGP93073.1 N-acetylmuramoyl-L-alanine amidase [Moorella glycerini]
MVQRLPVNIVSEVKKLPPTPRLTNLYSKVILEGEEQFSTVTIEATAPPAVVIDYPEPGACRVTLRALLNMYPGPLYVQDGILREVTVEPGEGQVTFNITLDEAVRATLTAVKGIPYRVVLRFSRRPLQEFYRDKVIILDPGHGGTDGGWRGPVNLWERDMAWKTALELARVLEGFKARVIWTRAEEENPSWEERLLKVTPATFCFISVHEHGAADAGQRGTAVLYNPTSRGNEELAAKVLERIVARVKTPVRGIKADEELARLGEVPGLRLEPVAITSWVDEGLLRNPYFHQKVALATAVAIKQHFRRGK